MRFQPGLKIARHRELINFFEGKFVPPINVEISPSGVCQARCEECFYKDSQSGKYMETELVCDVLHGMKEMGSKAVTWTGGGEPTNHHHFAAFIQLANHYGLKNGVITNALKVPTYGLCDWVRVSKTNHEWPVSHLQMIRRNTQVLGMNINYKGNEREVVESLAIAEMVGADYLQVRPALNRFGQTTNIEPPNIDHPLLLKTEYKFTEAKNPHRYPNCLAYHFVPFVWEEGKVAVCAYHKDKPEYILGDLHKDRFETIMKRAPRSMRVLPDCQVCCKNHELNRTLDVLANLEDVDFV
jgi:organic radical activating enzyme